MLGYEVTKNTIDMRAADAVLSLRIAFEKVETIVKWLANNPSTTTDGTTTDPLTQDPYGYTSDEAYALRLYFQDMEALRTSNQSTFDLGRKMTGLE